MLERCSKKKLHNLEILSGSHKIPDSDVLAARPGCHPLLLHDTLLLRKIILFIWFIIMILFSLKFNGFEDQVLHLFTSWSALITYVLQHQDGQHEEKKSSII